MNKFHFSKKGYNLAVEYQFEVGEWFKQLFYEMGQAYFYSATKDHEVYLEDVSEAMKNLIQEYYMGVGVHMSRFKHIPLNRFTQAKHEVNLDKITVAFSGGKDCIHLLLKLIESGIDKKDITCVYITNLNRSESFYEQQSGAEICAKLGVEYALIPINNSIPVNRSGHNIGLREQLVSTLALPIMVKNGSSILYFGNKIVNRPGQIWCTTPKPFELITERFAQSGITYQMMIHPGHKNDITDVDITNDMLENYPEYLQMSSSCYTQQNFREQKHKMLKQNLPDIPIYHGCGNCQKCVIINGCVYLKYKDTAPKGQVEHLKKHLNKKYQAKFLDNHDIQHLMEIINEQP